MGTAGCCGMTCGGNVTTTGVVCAGAKTGAPAALKGTASLFSTIAGTTTCSSGAGEVLLSTTLVSSGMRGMAGAPAAGSAGCPCSRPAPAPCCAATTGCSASTAERTVSFDWSIVVETGLLTGVVSTGCQRDSCDIFPSACGTAAASADFFATMAGRLFSWTGAFATGATLVTCGVSNGRSAGSSIVCPCADWCFGGWTMAVSFSWALKLRLSSASWCGVPSNPPTRSRS